MKFFKHFTDAHRGQSLQILRRKYDVAGIGRYWLFVELCAEKMTKHKEEEYSEKHCSFEFEKVYLMRCLGYANLKQCSSYLHALAELGLSAVQETPETYRCSMPKLLECIDRDSNRARTLRVVGAPKRKRKNKEKEEEIEYSQFTEAMLWNLLSELDQKSLRESFDSDYIDEQLTAMAFFLRKTTKRYTSWNSFVLRWLKRDLKKWEEEKNKQKTIQKTMGLIGA